MSLNGLQGEWCLLQNQFDSYEKYSLVIKLVSIVLLALAFNSGLNSVVILSMLSVLWLQDAIWKTFQSRIESRLLVLEASIAENTELKPCQFNREYQKNAHSGIGLIFEYLRQALRPTVAFPHIILIGISAFSLFI